jgi:tRNA 2-thiouridine synthesizing protein A
VVSVINTHERGSLLVEKEMEAGDSYRQRGVTGGSALEIGGIPEFEEVHVDKELNLKGRVCPYTFVESMLALEDMAIGQVLRIIIDHAPAACDVPRSLTREGYEILGVGKMNETDWSIVVRNKAFDQE